MHSLSKPKITFRKIFNSCVGTRRTAIQENLVKKVDVKQTAAQNYESKANNQKLYEVIPLSNDELEPVKPEDLIKLYSDKLLKLGSHVRSMYDEILAGSKKYLCCFCSYGEPTELDHFLPKSNYPEFSVLPINLVPICHYCNRLKLNQVPLSATECYVHPYFEEYSDIQWLDADLQFEGNVPIITFHINSDLKDKNANLSRKLEYQFKQLDLNMRYSTRANSEIMEMHFRLNGLHESGGSGAVRKYLEEEAYYRAEKNKNSWDSVLYYCISKNHKFCELYWNTK